MNSSGAGATGFMAGMRARKEPAGEVMAGTESSRENTLELTEESFEELFVRYEQKIFNLIFRMVGDYEDAVDLTSDTFAQALRGLPNFRRQSQPYTWLYRIAVNLCKNHFRRKSHRARFFGFSLDQKRGNDIDEMTPELEDNTFEPERLLETSELQGEVEKAISALPPDLKTAVILRDLQGLSYKEIAEILDCSLEAIKSRLFRARALLRESLADYVADTLGITEE